MSRKMLLLTTLILSSLIVLVAAPFTFAASSTWSRTFGGPAGDRAYSLVKTSDGGYALAGTTNSFGSGIINGYLVKTDSEGNMQWNQTYSGIGQAVVDAMIQTSDGGFALTGYSYSMAEGAGGINPWLAKTNSTGGLEWNQTYVEGGTAIMYGLAQTSDGGFALVGASSSLGEGGSEGLFIKTDANGTQQWLRSYGTAAEEEFFSVIPTSDGYTLGGYTNSMNSTPGFWLINTDINGTALWNQTYTSSGEAMLSMAKRTVDQGYLLVGYQINSTGTGSAEFLVMKTDSSGEVEWNQTYSQSNLEEALSGIQTSDGGYAFVGITNSSGKPEDTWLVKTDSLGNVQWNQTYGASAIDIAGAIVQADDGGYVMAGYTNSTGAGAEDFWMFKTDANGVVANLNSPSPSASPTQTGIPLQTPSPTVGPVSEPIPWLLPLFGILLAIVVVAVLAWFLSKRKQVSNNSRSVKASNVSLSEQGLVRCGKCGKTNPLGREHCKRCGARLVEQ